MPRPHVCCSAVSPAGRSPSAWAAATADSTSRLGDGGRAGWAALCRLISGTHLAGERGVPVLDLETLSHEVREALAAGDAAELADLLRGGQRR